ncbi:hypothetical protein KJ766_02755 [Patescibacteria group bacterium]|nr:hypothetical protein [Patescibacteria group bacterium]
MKQKRWIEREVVTAVHDNDLVVFLNSIGLLQKIEAGEVCCAKCGATVNLDNLGAVFPQNNIIQLICESPLCLSEIDMMKASHE